MPFRNLVIHGCTMEGGIEVLAFGERFTFWPPPRFAGSMQDAFANFGIEWYGGTVQREGFKCKVPFARYGDNHYDLVIEGDDPQTARVGLRPWRGDQSDPNAKVIWAEQQVQEESALPWFMR